MSGDVRQGTLAFVFSEEYRQRDATKEFEQRTSKTKSTDEAIKLLERRRAALIKTARRRAAFIAKHGADGTVHSRQVREAMADELDRDDAEHWLGAVFRSAEFEWTGKWHTYSDPARNIHERMVKVWRLK